MVNIVYEICDECAQEYPVRDMYVFESSYGDYTYQCKPCRQLEVESFEDDMMIMYEIDEIRRSEQ